jgi:hypothetical protein
MANTKGSNAEQPESRMTLEKPKIEVSTMCPVSRMFTMCAIVCINGWIMGAKKFVQSLPLFFCVQIVQIAFFIFAALSSSTHESLAYPLIFWFVFKPGEEEQQLRISFLPPQQNAVHRSTLCWV